MFDTEARERGAVQDPDCRVAVRLRRTRVVREGRDRRRDGGRRVRRDVGLGGTRWPRPDRFDAGGEGADALVDAGRIEARIAERVQSGLRRDLEHLLEETADAGVTRFVWLRQFEPGSNSADAKRQK